MRRPAAFAAGWGITNDSTARRVSVTKANALAQWQYYANINTTSARHDNRTETRGGGGGDSTGVHTPQIADPSVYLPFQRSAHHSSQPRSDPLSINSQSVTHGMRSLRPRAASCERLPYGLGGQGPRWEQTEGHMQRSSRVVVEEEERDVQRPSSLTAWKGCRP
jgi:hypothetical protein